jgi:PleD family two-component response regulator
MTTLRGKRRSASRGIRAEPKDRFPVSIRVGIRSIRKYNTFEHLDKAADDALYNVKNHERTRLLLCHVE